MDKVATAENPLVCPTHVYVTAFQFRVRRVEEVRLIVY